MIKAIKAAQRLDSRGNPTVQVDLTTEHGVFRAIVPSGASTGANEAVELRDSDPSNYGGKSVHKAIHNVESVIGPALIKSGLRVETDQRKIDELLIALDGTKNKANLGANAILGVSMACARAGAAAAGLELYDYLRRESGAKKPYVMPVPFFNVLNGGVHSGNKMAFQENMIAPVGASSFSEAVRMGSEVYQHLKTILAKRFGASAVGIGDEGGFAPPISQPHEALDLLAEAVSEAGYEGKIKFAIDPASSEFFRNGTYDLGFKDDAPNPRLPKQLMDVYHSLLSKYPIVLLEDPFAEDDWASWTEFCENCPVELVGDDLLVTNKIYVQEAHEKKACNAMLLKVNQIGTISEAIEAANLAYSYDWSVFVSHRSGETTDDFIADLVVGLRTGHIKSGAPCRGERVAKYNRLIEIEEALLARGEEVVYAGANFSAASRL
ncbi:enolase [Aspergillus aculeatinus CBS 121060]|uniref:Enolase n=1 Tax=Aspergillus aculeatinus CBS 121060 TaxID=1448322 RepID=A0ACD1H9Y6_9EURO|nr:enolase [Aspergillus aculeatinus CBS 121060]RAH70388.1 enolase [Aspergillus aculeatinus CBS 121060]